MRAKYSVKPAWLRLPGLCAALLLTAACSTTPGTEAPSAGLNPDMVSRAVSQAMDLRASGQRVWCVPFARNASGIDIRGNAHTWWPQASAGYLRGHQPIVGAVMVFSSTGKLPLGHVGVVSEVVSDREILIDHANWHKNQVSLGMPVIDVSEKNDWSKVRVKSQPDAFGRVYPVSGFISAPPERQG